MRERLDGLDGWRTISVLIVVTAHIQQYSSIRFALSIHHVDFGTLGVQFFFGISGFVICRGLLREVSVNLPAFYLRRFLRIIPPLLLYIFSITLLARFQIIDHGATGTVRALAFTCDFARADCGGWFGGHLWSLSAEEQFYLVIPFLFVVVRRRWLLTLLVLAIPVVALGMFAFGLKDLAFTTTDFVTIGLGVAAALNEARVRRCVTNTPTWLVVLGLLTIVALWSIPQSKDEVLGIPLSKLANTLRIVCVDPLIVFVLMASTFKETPIRSFLSSGPMRAFGVVTYSFYLWQQVATAAYPGASAWFYAASVSACAVLAFASYRWFESPLIALGARLSTRLRKSPSTTVAPDV